MKKIKRNISTLLTIALFLTGAFVWFKDEIYPSLVNNKPDIVVIDENPIEGDVVLMACDTNTVAKPNMKVNISKDGMYEYYGYTDDSGRLIKVTAKTLHHKSEVGRGSGQMCESRFPSNSNQEAKESIGFVTSGNDDRGHGIGDQFDGVSNAYNITSQNRITNATKFVAFENELAEILIENPGSITNYNLDIIYQGNDRRPTKYKLSVDVFGKTKTIEFLNDGSDLIGEW